MKSSFNNDRTRTRAVSQKGTSMVETAIVLLPFLALALAIIDFAFPIFLQSMFANAVREGSRFAITHQTSYQGVTYPTQTAAIKAVVRANALGFLSGPANDGKIRVKYFASTSPFGERTGTGSNRHGNIVEVSVVGYQWNWIAPLWRTTSPLGINVSSAGRLEPIAGGASPPAP